MRSPDRDLGVAQKIGRGALAFVTVVSTTFGKAPEKVNASNLLQNAEGNESKRVLVKTEEDKPQIKDIQYPQYREVVIVTIPSTDISPKPTSFYAEVLEPIDGQKPNEEHIGWYDQGIRKEGLMGEENITPLANQEQKIDFEGNGQGIDCRIVATKMNEDGKVEVEIIWINQSTNQEERGWVGIEKLSVPFGKGGTEANTQATLEINRVPVTQITRPVAVGETLDFLAAKYETSVDEIKEENNLLSETVYPGQLLKISTTTVYIIKPWETFESIAAKYKIPLFLLATANAMFYTKDFSYMKPGVELEIPRRLDELTFKNRVSIRASSEWTEAEQRRINIAGEAIVDILDSTRLLNGYNFIEVYGGEIPVHFFSPERESELVALKDKRIGEFRYQDLSNPNNEWGIYIHRAAVQNNDSTDFWCTVAHEFFHNTNNEHTLAYVAGFRVCQYLSWAKTLGIEEDKLW